MKKRNIVLFSIIIAVIIIIIICIILSIQYNKSRNDTKTEEEGVIQKEIDTKLKRVSIRNNFYIVKSCIEKFYIYWSEAYNTEDDINIIDEEAKKSMEETKKETAQVLFNIMDEDYINFNKITTENVISKLGKLSTSNINITDMYVSQQKENISIYFVEGYLREKSTNKISNFKLMLKLDTDNGTFSILLEDYIDKNYNNIEIDSNIKIGTKENIEKNNDNKYEYKHITDSVYAIDLLDQYRENILYNPNIVYNELEENYKNTKYSTLNNFQIKAKENVKQNVIMELIKFQKMVQNDYTQYICVDQNENYYIFNEIAPMKYEIILDVYSVDLAEFTEKYNNATEKEKIEMNIQRFFDAINDGDYKYAYNKLDSTYKQNKFPTQNDFETYMKKTFFKKNKLGYKTYKKSGDLYIYDMVISDRNDSTKTINKNFVVKLLEGTDFVMSFSAE